MFRGLIEPWHLIILVVLIAVIFGWKKLPDAARSLGRSMRIFKAEVEEMKHDSPSAASRDTVDGEKVTRTTTTHTEHAEAPAPQQPHAPQQAPAAAPHHAPAAAPQATSETTTTTTSTEWVDPTAPDYRGGSGSTSSTPRV